MKREVENHEGKCGEGNHMLQVLRSREAAEAAYVVKHGNGERGVYGEKETHRQMKGKEGAMVGML